LDIGACGTGTNPNDHISHLRTKSGKRFDFVANR
jgi:hypothetical protein